MNHPVIMSGVVQVPEPRAHRTVLVRVGLLFGGITLVAVGEVLNLTHAHGCRSVRAADCWAGPVQNVPLIMGLITMATAACLRPQSRSLHWWDGPIVLLLAIALGVAAVGVSDAVNPGDDAWDGRDGPINVLVWTLGPLCVFLTYFTLRMRSAAAIAAAVLTTALTFVLTFVLWFAAVLLSGGGN